MYFGFANIVAHATVELDDSLTVISNYNHLSSYHKDSWSTNSVGFITIPAESPPRENVVMRGGTNVPANTMIVMRLWSRGDHQPIGARLHRFLGTARVISTFLSTYPFSLSFVVDILTGRAQ